MAMGAAKKRNAGPATQAAAEQFLMQVETAYNLLKDREFVHATRSHSC